MATSEVALGAEPGEAGEQHQRRHEQDTAARPDHAAGHACDKAERKQAGQVDRVH
jgi:hypothetical protein